LISDRQIKYIVVLDSYGSFVEAARYLGVTQPTLSMQIKKAEELLGVVIFDREKAPLRPTDKGEEIIIQCRRILKEMEKLEIIITSDTQYKGTFNIGIIPTIAPYLIPLFIKSFEKKYPNVQLNIVERQTEVILRELKEEKLDFGILATPTRDDKIYEKVLYYEGFKFFINKDNKLLNRKDVDLDKLANETIYQLEDGHCLRYQTEQICGRLNGKLNQNIYLSGGQLQTLINLTQKFGGLTLVPELFIHYLHKQDQLLIRPIKGVSMAREVSLVSSRYFVHEDILNILEEEIIANLPLEITSHKKSKIKIIPIS